MNPGNLGPARARKSKPTLADMLAAVDVFAQRMKRRIMEEEQTGRDEWQKGTLGFLHIRLTEETNEVGSALTCPQMTPEEFADHCANAANYSMILCEIALRKGLDEARCLHPPR